MFFHFVTKHACGDRKDRQREDGQNYDSQDRASTVASRCKNWLKLNEYMLAIEPTWR